MTLTNQQLKCLQNGLRDIVNNIEANMDIIGNEEINNTFFLPIMKIAADISDKVFTQTKDTIHEINL